jgi:hypothetical protein
VRMSGCCDLGDQRRLRVNAGGNGASQWNAAWPRTRGHLRDTRAAVSRALDRLRDSHAVRSGLGQASARRSVRSFGALVTGSGTRRAPKRAVTAPTDWSPHPPTPKRGQRFDHHISLGGGTRGAVPLPLREVRGFRSVVIFGWEAVWDFLRGVHRPFFLEPPQVVEPNLIPSTVVALDTAPCRSRRGQCRPPHRSPCPPESCDVDGCATTGPVSQATRMRGFADAAFG